MTGHMPLTAETIRRLTLLTDPWLSCDDCFDQVDAVIENVLGGTVPMNEAFRVHLNGCSACFDEAVALAELIAPDFTFDPEHAADLLVAATSAPGAPSGGAT